MNQLFTLQQVIIIVLITIILTGVVVRSLIERTFSRPLLILQAVIFAALVMGLSEVCEGLKSIDTGGKPFMVLIFFSLHMVASVGWYASGAVVAWYVFDALFVSKEKAAAHLRGDFSNSSYTSKKVQMKKKV